MSWKNMMILGALVGIAIPAMSAQAQPAPADQPQGWHVALEIDPLNQAVGGGGLVVLLRPKRPSRLRVGVLGFTAPIPDVATPEGWGATIRPGYGIEALYSLGKKGRGLQVGLLGSLNQWEYTHEDERGVAYWTEAGVMPFVGFHWFPFQHGAARGLYLRPWGGVGIPLSGSGTRTVGSHTYEPALPVSPFAALHIGYELRAF